MDVVAAQDSPESGPRPHSRATRVFGASVLGYISQVLTVAVGLWLTPFLLKQLGANDYGLWLLALQLTSYLILLDLGVVALLPRETAFAIGRADGDRSTRAIAALVGRTVRIVMCQMPFVAAILFLGMLALPAAWQSLSGPLYVIAGGFLLMFPARILHALLQGLQETPFLAQVQIGTWALGTTITVVLVLVGLGLYAVAIGWVTAQAIAALLWWQRVRSRHPSALPSTLPALTRGLVAGWSRSGLWVSVAQVAQMLLAGTDLVIIGHALGPAAIVPFAVTGKLIAVLANQPAMVMQSAQPALSEMRANAGEKHRLLSVTTALAQLMLLISGGVFLIVIATNEGFVSWWVGPSQYAGFAVTASLLVSMMLRHWNTTTIFALFAFGHERRIALTALADGVLTVALSIVLVGTLGSLGAVLASIIGVCVASLPSNLRALAASTNSSVSANIAPLVPWLVRFVCLSVATVLALHSRDVNSFARLAAVTIVVSTLYVAVMLPIARRAPLGDYVSPLLRRVRESIPEFRSHALTWYEKK